MKQLGNFLKALHVIKEKIKNGDFSDGDFSGEWHTESPFDISSVFLVLGVIALLVWLIRKLLLSKKL